MTVNTRMTAMEFLSLPPDGIRSELVHGEVVMMASPSFEHGFAVTRLLVLLATHVESHTLGIVVSDIDTYFSPDDARRPDVLFFAANRLHLIAAAKKPEVPPDLCVEVLSPSNAGYDRTDKFDLYQGAGVPFYWIVDPMERAVEAYRLENGIYLRSGHGTGDEVLQLPPFPDLSIPLARLWLPNMNPNQ